VVGKGTTNVDFNAGMRAALARIRDDAGLDLSVGAEALTLRSGGHRGCRAQGGAAPALAVWHGGGAVLPGGDEALLRGAGA
jgi:hypothetical protein